MAAIADLHTAAYRIPLPTVLTDSTHGTMRAFELITAWVRDSDGQEGTGYTFTVGRNGRAALSVLRDEIAEIVTGADADRIEHLWQSVWWATHYGGRGGPTVLALSAFDMALWDQGAPRRPAALAPARRA